MGGDPLTDQSLVETVHWHYLSFELDSHRLQMFYSGMTGILFAPYVRTAPPSPLIRDPNLGTIPPPH